MRKLGTQGNDIIDGGDGNDALFGFGGDDIINGFAGRDLLYGGDGRDFLAGGDGNDVIYGGPGFRDTLTGGAGNDFLSGDAGDDRLFGGDGNDTLNGGEGSDFLAGESGNDVIRGGNGFNVADGGDGSDTIVGGNERDSFGGEAGNDVLYGKGGNDFLLGHDGNDILNGGAGNDELLGGNGNDILRGEAGSDTLDGGIGRDTLNGGAGDDSLVGGMAPLDGIWPVSEGGDVMLGGAGDDTLNGFNSAFGGGDPDIDTMSGGSGNDLYVVDNAGDLLSDSSGIDQVVAHGVGWTLAPQFENLKMESTYYEESLRGTGNAKDNVLDARGVWKAALYGLGGDDLLMASGRSATLSGGSGDDTLQANDLYARLEGGTGRDVLTGSDSGADEFVFRAPAGLANADHVTNFEAADDQLFFDGTVFAALGGDGTWSAADERFYAAPGAVTAHDSSDRLVYNSSTGVLYYDADGAGGRAAVPVGTLDGAPPLAADDITVFGSSNAVVGTPGADLIDEDGGNDTIHGGEGNDGVWGGDGNDRLFGEGSDDWLDGGSGNDLVSGCDGSDVLRGSQGRDTLAGGAGWDYFVFDTPAGSTNIDHITDFHTEDELTFLSSTYSGLGEAETLSAGDARFYAAAGATSAHDASDRLVYNTSTGVLYYDPDGIGGKAALAVAVLDHAPTLSASDITVA